MIRARDVTFCYGERRILDGINLDVQAGEFVGLLRVGRERLNSTERLFKSSLVPSWRCVAQ